MLSRGKILKGLALAAFLLCAARPAAAYTDLHPYVAGGSVNTLTLGWATAAGPFTGALSTDPNFGSFIYNGALLGNSTTYTGLNPNTTFYFRIKVTSEDNGAYTTGTSNTISISTIVAAPSAAYFESNLFRAPSSYTAVAGLGWNTSGNPDWTTYEVHYADNPGFSPERTGLYQLPPVSLAGLNANTTYYFKVRARSFGGTYTGYTGTVSSATLAMELQVLGENADETSAAVSWARVYSLSDQAQDSEGYAIAYSLTESLSSPSLKIVADHAAASGTLSPLTRNTLYYYRAGSLNWIGATKPSPLRSFTTLAAPLQGFARATAAGDWSDWTESAASFGWTALPAAPDAASALGYRLEASTSNFSGGAVLSATGYDVALSTLTVTQLDSNTTYYFRAGSLNTAGVPNYTASLSSVTLAQPIAANLTYTEAAPQQITVHFPPWPDAPQALSCTGYRLEASSLPFGGGAAVFFSSTSQVQTFQLTVAGLTPNVLYYLRLGTLNLQKTPNYSQLTPALTPLPGTFSGPTLTEVWQTTATVNFTPAAENPSGYVVQASSDQYFDFVHRSSATTNPLAASLRISNLNENTDYYFRAGVLFNGATIYVNTTPSHEYTHPKTLTGQAVAAVFYSSVTVSWTPGQLTSTEAHHILMEASTSTTFSTVLFSSTSDTSAPGLTVGGLAYNTSYYFRLGAVNPEGGTSYTPPVPATSTLANFPGEDTYLPYISSITVRWFPGSNPPDTRYLVEMSSYSNFTPLVGSSVTVLSSATISPLEPNITYWTRVTAINRLGRLTPAVEFQATATGAHDPGYQPFSDIGVTSMTINWRGNNPQGTRYLARISTSANFDTLLSSMTDRCSGNYCDASFYGLISNVTYYLNVSALNSILAPTLPPVDLGQALTRPATPYILTPAKTFTELLIDGFVVKWGANGNSPLTRYKVMASESPSFSVISSTLYPSTTTCTFSGLTAGTTYWVRIQTLGQAGAYSLALDTGTATTLTHRETSVVAQQDNTITLNTSYGPIVLFVPKGAIGSSIYSLNMTPISVFTDAGSAASELHPTGIGIEIVYFPQTLVLNPLTITLPYNIAALPPGTDRSKLVLALFDETNQLWVPLPSVSDTANHRVIAQTWHLSTFQLMEGVSQTGLKNVKIYPNPYKPNSVFNVMHFTNMTAYAKVKIYTFLGELVKEFKADVNGMAHWDGLNEAGEKVATGVYIAYIQSQDKKLNKTFKVAIER